jgi:hypothetical protein
VSSFAKATERKSPPSPKSTSSASSFSSYEEHLAEWGSTEVQPEPTVIVAPGSTISKSKGGVKATVIVTLLVSPASAMYMKAVSAGKAVLGPTSAVAAIADPA